MKDFKRVMMVVAMMGVPAAAGMAVASAAALAQGKSRRGRGRSRCCPTSRRRSRCSRTRPAPSRALGGSRSYSGGAPAAWVRFTLRNNVAVKTSEFTFKRVIERAGVKVYDPAAEKAALGPKEVKVFAAERVYFSGRSNAVEARMLADIGDFVPETNEANNAAKYTVKASVVH